LSVINEMNHKIDLKHVISIIFLTAKKENGEIYILSDILTPTIGKIIQWLKADEVFTHFPNQLLNFYESKIIFNTTPQR